MSEPQKPCFPWGWFLLPFLLMVAHTLLWVFVLRLRP